MNTYKQTVLFSLNDPSFARNINGAHRIGEGRYNGKVEPVWAMPAHKTWEDLKYFAGLLYYVDDQECILWVDNQHSAYFVTKDEVKYVGGFKKVSGENVEEGNNDYTYVEETGSYYRILTPNKGYL